MNLSRTQLYCVKATVLTYEDDAILSEALKVLPLSRSHRY